MTWFVACEFDPIEDPERAADNVWTISRRPDRAGWNTDSGTNGYGLSRVDAQRLADGGNALINKEYQGIDIELLADSIAMKIIQDLSDRIGDEWGHIDEDIKQQIRDFWTTLILGELRK